MPKYRSVPKPTPPPVIPEIDLGTDFGIVFVDPSPKKPKFKLKRAEERSFTYSGNGQFQRIIYGEHENVGGILTWWKALADGTIIVKYDISYGPIEEISNLRLEGKVISNWAAGSEIKLGTPDQAISDIFLLNRAGWVPTNYPGIAHVIIIIPGGVEIMPDILRFTCNVKGKLLLDPTQDDTLTTKFPSEDPSLIIADLIVSKRYGGRSPLSSVNWTMLKDVTVPFCTGTEIATGIKRYPIAIIITEESKLEDVIENIRLHAQLYVSYYDGMYHIWPDTVKTFSGITLTDDDLSEGGYYRTKGSSEVFDRLDVEYTDSINGWVNKTVELERPGFSNENVPVEKTTYSLLGTKFEQQAIRIGTYHLNRSLLDKIFFFTCPFQKGSEILPGDWIKLTETDSISVVNQDIVILQIDITNGDYVYQAVIYDEAIFSDVIVTQVVEVDSENPSPLDPPLRPLSPSGNTTLVFGDGFEIVNNGVNVTWSANIYPFETRFRIYSQETGGPLVLEHDNIIGFGPMFVEIGTVNKTISVYAFIVLTLIVSAFPVDGECLPEDVYPAHPVTLPNPVSPYTGIPAVSWNRPQNRLETKYGSAYWSSGGGATGFDAAKINDGLFVDTAVTLGNNAYVQIDFGTAVELNEILFKINYPSLPSELIQILYSDDGSSFNDLFATVGEKRGGPTEVTWVGSPALTSFIQQVDGATAHRWYRFKNPTFTNINVKEIQPYIWTGPNENIIEYRIYDIYGVGTAGKKLVKTIRAESYTDDEFIKLDEIAVYESGINKSIFAISSISKGNDESTLFILQSAWIVDNTNVTSSQVVTRTVEMELENKEIDVAKNTLILDSTDLGDSADLVRTTDTAVPLADVNVTDGKLSLNGMRFVNFLLEFQNSGGLLKHRIIETSQTNDPVNATLISGVSGTSDTLTTTPLVDASTAFATGVGVDAGATQRVILDSGAIPVGWTGVIAVIDLQNTTVAGRYAYVSVRALDTNINGVTRRRLALTLTDSAGAAASVTGVLGAGQVLRIRVFGFLPVP